MTPGDFDVTAAHAALERARRDYADARDAAVAAYQRRADTLEALKVAEDAYALALAFDGAPPSVGDTVREGLAPGYGAGTIVEIRVLKSTRGRELASVHLVIDAPEGRYVARRPIPAAARAEQRKAATL